MQEYCREGISDETCLLELEQYTEKVIVSYVECKRCGQKGCHVEENREQRVISNRQKWCGCQKKMKVAYPIEEKVQQGGTWAVDPESAAKERSKQREVRQTFKMLKEVWLNIGIEKIDTHERVTVKVLLDSSCKGTSSVA